MHVDCVATRAVRNARGILSFSEHLVASFSPIPRCEQRQAVTPPLVQTDLRPPSSRPRSRRPPCPVVCHLTVVRHLTAARRGQSPPSRRAAAPPPRSPEGSSRAAQVQVVQVLQWRRRQQTWTWDAGQVRRRAAVGSGAAVVGRAPRAGRPRSARVYEYFPCPVWGADPPRPVSGFSRRRPTQISTASKEREQGQLNLQSAQRDGQT